ncbi:MAG: hypothetical protein ACOCYT_02345 [Chloroflexota bacterium]
MLRLFALFLLVSLLTACGGGDNTDGESDVESVSDPAAVIQWDRNPSNIIFRADIASADAEEGFFARSEIPLCTIYGDGRVIWLSESAADPIDSVLTGPVDDQRIRFFVENVTFYRDIYSYGAEADLQMSETPPIVETLYINVNDVEHVTDMFSGWDDQYFESIVTECQTLSPRPQIYRPDGAWIRVREESYNPNQPSVLWDADVTGMDLAEIAASGEPIWVTGRLARLFWSYRTRAPLDLQYSQGAGNFVVAMEIPNLTRFSPPAP